MDRLQHDLVVSEFGDWSFELDEGTLPGAPGGRHANQRATAFAEAAAPDIPAEIGRMMLWSYALMMAALFLFFATSVEASMMVVISAGYTAIYLGVPAILIAGEGRSGGRSMADFLSKGLVIATGHIGGREAAAQILLIPVAITIAIIAIGTAARLIL
ncbi:hypothetical protein [Sphingopyxis sp. KK2]|uniref:hypothetical protein n=1 Tax=Sphingopyxis sp. KK2 TaxID=1855727 RepID=UPI00097E6B06|nr:hypothetical protein [Sphingopyxis sp. KK2]